VLYGGGLRYPLVFDDYGLSQHALRSYYAEATARIGQVRWLTYASFGWIQALLGPDREWQRVTNILLHVGTALALFGFLARLFEALLAGERTRGLALFGALWFLVHPAAVYGVAYLMQRSIILATLFSLLALRCVLEGLLRRSARWYAAAALAYVLALSSKELAVMLPAVAAALAVLVRGPSRDLLRALGGWLLALAAIGAFAALQRRALLGAAYEAFAGEILARLGVDAAIAYPLSVENQATLFFRYLATWLAPWPGWMSVDVRTPFPTELLGWPHSAGFVAWLAYAVVATWLLLRRGRLGLAGFGLLFPWLLALTEMSAVRVQEPFVLYRSYLWMSGLPAILPVLTAPLGARWRVGALAALCAALAVAAHGRIETFSSALALWDDAARKNTTPGAPYVERAYVSRGLAELSAARFDAAAADFARALELNPRSPDAYLGRGTLRLRQGELAGALADFDRAIALDPAYPSPYNKRCVVKAGLGRAAEALADCEKAAALDPLNDEVWINAGVVYRSLGRGAEAAAAYRRALELKPKSGSAHYNYGILLLDSGRRDPEVRGHFILACDAGVAEACEILRRAAR